MQDGQGKDLILLEQIVLRLQIGVEVGEVLAHNYGFLTGVKAFVGIILMEQFLDDIQVLVEEGFAVGNSINLMVKRCGYIS